MVTGAVAALVIPGIAEYLVYDRGALAQGELWRLLSAHLVHYSGAHLFTNLLVLVPAALLVETRYREDLLKILAVCAVAIGVGLFFFQEEIYRYAGASGISLSLLTYAALRGLDANTRWRVVCAILLAMVAIKLVAEAFVGWQVADWEQDAGFVTVTFSHATGAGTALVIWITRKAKQVQVSRIFANSVRD
jgi:rhomboid family GlyGly-CTERM serine protease